MSRFQPIRKINVNSRANSSTNKTPTSHSASSLFKTFVPPNSKKSPTSAPSPTDDDDTTQSSSIPQLTPTQIQLLLAPTTPSRRPPDPSTKLWADRYRPKTIAEIIGQDRPLRQLCDWLERYSQNDPSIKRCVLISGDSGLGKTSSAYVTLENYGYKVHELNASDVRTKTQIQQTLYRLIHIRTVDSSRNQKPKPIAIIMDEIDGMDKGGLSEIMKYINPDRGKGNRKKEDRERRIPIPPIICICNNGSERKLMDFHKDCMTIQYKKPTRQHLQILLNRIAKAESIQLDVEATELILDYAQLDYRRLLNYLQSLDSLIIDKANTIIDAQCINDCNTIIGQKTQDMGLEESVTHLLEKDPDSLTAQEALKVYQNHKSQYVCSIYENYGHILTHDKRLKPLQCLEKMSQVMDDIAFSDLIDKIIHKNQLWYLHKVHGTLTCYLPSLTLQGPDPPLYTSSSRSRFNQQKNNEKDMYLLSSNLNTTTGHADIQILSQIVLHLILDNPTKFTPETPQFKAGVNYLRQYGLTHEHTKTLARIDRLTPHKKFTHRQDVQIRQAFE